MFIRLSMWVSNTATVVMLFPIALAMIDRMTAFDPRDVPTTDREQAHHNFEGDKTRASRFIGWSRPKLYRRMRYYGIPIDFARAARRLR